MCDTFNPLKLSAFARGLDDGVYWRSWYENAQPGGRRAGRRRDGRRAHLAPFDRLRSVFSRNRVAGLAWCDRGDQCVGLAAARQIVFGEPTLNTLLALGPKGWWKRTRSPWPALTTAREQPSPLAETRLRSAPFDVADYVDFYSSLEHASNMGRILRPDAEDPLPRPELAKLPARLPRPLGHGRRQRHRTSCARTGSSSRRAANRCSARRPPRRRARGSASSRRCAE